MLQAEVKDLMTTLVKIHRKGQMTLPSRMRAAIGVSEGGVLQATLRRGQIVITPKVAMKRSQFTSAQAEYTPAQRRAIDRGIAQSEKEYKQGRSFGPFDTHEHFLASLHRQVAKLPAKKSKRPAK